jgi:hypothetical protein
MEGLLRAVGGGQEAEAMRIHREIHDQGIDSAEFLSQAIEALRSMLVLLACGPETDLLDLTPEARHSLADVAKEWGVPRVLYGMGLLADTLKSAKLLGEGRALVDLALVKLARSEQLRSLDEIVSDLRDLEGRIGSGSSGAPAGAAPSSGPVERTDRTLFRGATDLEGALRGEESVGLTIDTVRRAWEEVLSRVRQRSSAAGSFLASGSVTGLTDEAVTLGFPPSARFQRSQLADPDHIRVIESEIEEVLGVTLRFRTEEAEASDESGAPEPEEEGPPRAATRSEVERIHKEPIVGLLKNLFMARLIHIERT